ncbi:MAG: IS1/IS1595 family N-terminal zinc-binding domain-containing protein [Ardenticatenaceae bacterium]
MIEKTISYRCRRCASPDIVKNGHTAAGKQKYHCKRCGTYGTLQPTARYSAARKAEVIRAYQERSSLRGLQRTFGIARQTIAPWVKEAAIVFGARAPVHQCVGKETGQTAHVERWINTLHQRLARFVRNPLSFSKTDAALLSALKLFIHRHHTTRVLSVKS